MHHIQHRDPSGAAFSERGAFQIGRGSSGLGRPNRTIWHTVVGLAYNTGFTAQHAVRLHSWFSSEETPCLVGGCIRSHRSSEETVGRESISEERMAEKYRRFVFAKSK